MKGRRRWPFLPNHLKHKVLTFKARCRWPFYQTKSSIRSYFEGQLSLATLPNQIKHAVLTLKSRCHWLFLPNQIKHKVLTILGWISFNRLKNRAPPITVYTNTANTKPNKTYSQNMTPPCFSQSKGEFETSHPPP